MGRGRIFANPMIPVATRSILVFGVIAASIFPRALHARLELARTFTDRAVLQHGKSVPIWGTASPGESITVRFAGNEVATVADGKGSWKVELPPLPVSATGRELVVEGSDNTISLQDILVGEVWLCSGQSNMQYSLQQTEDGKTFIPMAKDPNLRWFMRPPGKRERDTWLPTSPDMAKGLSAVAYFFGRNLREGENVPVGLIVRAVGGTTIQRWADPDGVRTNPYLAKKIGEADAKENEFEKYEAEKEKYDKRNRPTPEVQQWLSEMSKLTYYRGNFGGLYNRMIRPLQPYAIKGVIWYQGEFNNRPGQAWDYREWQPELINGWRKAWKQEDLPFLFVQMQVLGNATTATLRESQLLTLDRCPNTAMAVICDQSIGLHPPLKKIAGDRLAMAAKELVYGKPTGGLSPRVLSVEKLDDTILLTFDHVGKGLQPAGKPLTGFMIRGRSGAFIEAQATIEGADQVRVWAEGVSHPEEVRYAWLNDPREVMSLTNHAGVPASPFRTDPDTDPSVYPMPTPVRRRK